MKAQLISIPHVYGVIDGIGAQTLYSDNTSGFCSVVPCVYIYYIYRGSIAHYDITLSVVSSLMDADEVLV